MIKRAWDSVGEPSRWMSRLGPAQVGAMLKMRVQPVGGRAMSFAPQVLVCKSTSEFRWQGRLGLPGLFTQGERFSGLLVPLLRSQLNAGTRSGFDAMNEALKRRALAEANSM